MIITVLARKAVDTRDTGREEAAALAMFSMKPTDGAEQNMELQ